RCFLIIILCFQFFAQAQETLTNEKPPVFEDCKETNVENPDHLIGTNIPIASRILTVVNEFDKLVLGRISEQKLSQQQAIDYLKQESKTYFDPEIVNAYIKLLSSDTLLEQHNIDLCLGVNMLEPGMHLSQDLLNKQGAVVLTQGTEITPTLIEKLKSYEKEWRYIFNVFVH
ncbi:MAG: HD domain-containing phosphohydrolase, partial [Pseudoalteromonas spongiae]